MTFSSYWIDDPDHDIEHYGVKGMKWGVRKSEYKSMSRAQRKQVRKDYKTAKAYGKRIQRRFPSIYNTAADRIELETYRMNDRYGDSLSDTETYRKYVKEYQKKWNDMLVSETLKQVGSMPKNITTDKLLDMIPFTVSDKQVDELVEIQAQRNNRDEFQPGEEKRWKVY